MDCGVLKHDPEKWTPVFRKDHAPAKKLERRPIQSETIALSARSKIAVALERDARGWPRRLGRRRDAIKNRSHAGSTLVCWA
jgi:hypothetical protein